jgi:hypothetical protein
MLGRAPDLARDTARTMPDESITPEREKAASQLSGRARGSGAAVAQRFGAALEVRSGHIVRWGVDRDRAGAVNAVAPEE